MKKILLSIGALAIAGVVVVGATSAIFSDEEISTGNTFTAGAIDLKVDSKCTYNGVESDECGTWGQPDGLDIVSEKFFNFSDIKPGDEGENTISLHVLNNDAYVCAIIDNMKNDDLGITEPEAEDGDTTDGAGNGELAEELNFFAWADDGDNVWESGELPLFSNIYGPASDVLNSKVYPLYTPATTALPGDTTAYIGLYWCYGDLTVDQGANSLSCSGASVTNLSQSDSVSADIAFVVEQARNNENFTCPSPDQRPSVGANLADYSAPASCTVIVDETGQGYTSIQNAINGVSDGAVICVADGEYNEFIVNKPITIAGLTNPNTGSAKVVPSGPSVTELALITSSDVTITGLHFDGNGTAFTGSQTAGVQISPSGSSLNNVNIVYNIIENLAATGGASNKGIQWWTNTASGFSLINSDFSNNVIDNITSENKGAYGIQTVGALSNLTIGNNTISNIDGGWEAGISLDSKDLVSTTNVSVNKNHIMSGIATFSVQVEANVDGGGIAINQNNLETLLYGGSSLIGSPDILNAENNWWGTATPAVGTDVFLSPVTNVVDFSPAEGSAFPTN